MAAALKKFTASDFTARKLSPEAADAIEKVMKAAYRDQQALLKKAAKIK